MRTRAMTAAGAALAGVVAYDLTQRRHAILRNFPVVGHLRYLLEAFGPELRQYIVTGNDEERPFSRNERRWIYATAKRQDPHFGFGSDVEWSTRPGHVLVKHAAFPQAAAGDAEPAGWPMPCAKVLGGAHRRRHAFRPPSAVNVSGMSFGALGGHAIEAISRGSAAAGCMQNTGEGGLSRHHLHGSDLVFQIGTAYFGCRDARGRFDLGALTALTQAHPIRAIEVKLSQGAKPGVGALLPAAKVTPEIAAARGVPAGVDCHSPAAHTAFHDVPTLMEFIERVAEATGLPVGIKSAVGEEGFWEELAARMAREGTGPDHIAIDGGEGGTGAGPLVFTDHVALPFRLGLGRVYPVLAEAGVADRVVVIGAGKLGLPENALLAFAMGCDMVSVGREAMMAVGCIQAQRCHTGRCPTGVATQSPWLQRGLIPDRASERLASYVAGLRAELLRLARACGVPHPALVACDRIELLDGEDTVTAAERFGYRPGWGLPGEADRAALLALMDELARRRPEAEPQTIPTRPGEAPHVP
jgi:glutamate synthase domain-containing protein 2